MDADKVKMCGFWAYALRRFAVSHLVHLGSSCHVNKPKVDYRTMRETIWRDRGEPAQSCSSHPSQSTRCVNEAFLGILPPQSSQVNTTIWMTPNYNRQKNHPGEASKPTESWKTMISVSSYLESETAIQHRLTEPYAGEHSESSPTAGEHADWCIYFAKTVWHYFLTLSMCIQLTQQKNMNMWTKYIHKHTPGYIR